jgi:hypothetical protein
LLLEATEWNKYHWCKLYRSIKGLPADLIDALDDLYDTNDPETLGRRRGRVLESLAEKKVFEKYPDDESHVKAAGDVEVTINGQLQGPGNLDVCVWTTCAAHSGEFYDCKAGVWDSDRLGGKVKLLDKIYNGLCDPLADSGPVAGIISFQNECFLRSKLAECSRSSHITAVGFESLRASFKNKRVCDCINDPTLQRSG